MRKTYKTVSYQMWTAPREQTQCLQTHC